MFESRKYCAALVLAVLIASEIVCGDDVRVQINLKKPLHAVANEFVSFSMTAADLGQLQDEADEQFAAVASSMSPAYVQVVNDGKEGAVSLIGGAQWLNSFGFTPVLNMLHTADWSSRSAVRQLGAFYRAGVAKCVWQLGSELSSSDPIRYVDDLATLREISEAFGNTSWGVIGADVSAANSPDEAQFYVELSQNFVEATGWMRSSVSGCHALVEPPRLGEDPTTVHALEYTNRPLWLNNPFHADIDHSLTNTDKETSALYWAAQLGSSALNGFSAIFQRISNTEIATPTMNLYTSILHKLLMDRKVFDTQILDNASDQLHFFTHCSRNVSGAFTVMGVNLDEARQKVTSKLPTATTGSKVEQFILTQSRMGDVQLNGKTIDWATPIVAQTKSKKPNRLTSFVIPGKSVAFWVFPDANIKECRSTTRLVEPEPLSLRTKTGAEKLLQKLLLESIASSPQVRRQRRDLEIIKGLESIDKMFTDKPKLDLIQQELLSKMVSLINDLQKLTNNITATEMKPLHQELKKIEQLTKTDDPFPIKVSNVYEPQQREQMRQKCKIIAHTLEKQCLRDLDPHVNLLPMRGLSLKRMRRNIQPQMIRQFADDNDDIRTNRISRDHDNADPLAKLFSAIYSPDKRSGAFGFVGVAPTTSTTPMPTTTTPSKDILLQAVRNPINDGSAELMKVFNKVAVRVVDLINRQLTKLWNCISEDDGSNA